MKVTCSWCDTLNPVEDEFCSTCGHRAQRARMFCDCPRCSGPLIRMPVKQKPVKYRGAGRRRGAQN